MKTVSFFSRGQFVYFICGVITFAFVTFAALSSTAQTASADSTKKVSWAMKVQTDASGNLQQIVTPRTRTTAAKIETGKMYVVRTSKKTGKTYNQYIEVAAK